jgi:polyisoprenoid-binding protein YceI
MKLWKGVALPLLGLTLSLQASVSEIDPARSSLSVVFEQMGVPVEGAFTRFSGTLHFDPAEPAAASAELRIATASFDLGLEDFNAEVAKPEWLDSRSHPEARYQAQGLTPLGEGRYRADGELTLKGRSAALPAEIRVEEAADHRVFSGSVRFSRKAFDVGDAGWDGVVNDEVQVRFRIVQPRSVGTAGD